MTHLKLHAHILEVNFPIYKILRHILIMFIIQISGVQSLLYLHIRVFGTYLLGGGDYSPCKKDYKVMVFYM